MRGGLKARNPRAYRAGWLGLGTLRRLYLAAERLKLLLGDGLLDHREEDALLVADMGVEPLTAATESRLGPDDASPRSAG